MFDNFLAVFVFLGRFPFEFFGHYVEYLSILELQCHSLEKVIGIGQAGLMGKAFMPGR